ncbi:MAG: UPF0182 family protein [Thermoleophilia bacterium]|jgi:hypothetical protein
MNQQPYEPFSRLWDSIAKRLKLDSDAGPPDGNVRPIRTGKPGGRRLAVRLSIAAVIILIFIFLAQGIYLYTEWLWFGEVGFTSVFLKTLTTKIWMGLAAGGVFFAIVYGNMLLARRMAPRYQFGPGTEIIERAPVSDKLMRWLIPLLLLLPTLIAAGAGSSGWEDLLKFINRADFGITDPVFGYDTGFYVFSLPFLRLLQSFVWWTLIFTLIVTAAMHFFDYAINWSENKLIFAPHVKGHLSVIMGLIMFTLGAGYLLKGYVLMFSPRGVVFGASYTDVHAQLPVFKFMAATALVAGLLFLVNIYFKGWKLPAAAIVLIILTGILAGRAYPFIVQQYQVSPNELDKESPYIKYSIDFTRHGFDLESIEQKPFAVNDNLSAADVQQNVSTISNIRLWDPATLAQTYGQIQTIRPYYKFRDVDVDRYQVGGRRQQTMLSIRELSVDDLDSRAKTWQNEHLIYTHGYGMVMSPVAEVSAEGLPQLSIKDIPPVSSTPDLEVSQPAVYFGEKANDYVVVRSTTQEFDYPKGNENVYTTYEGNGGIDVSNKLNRLAFSWRYASLKLFLSDSITDQSRIMIHREIRDRIQNIAPFLLYDSDPYSVLIDGRIFWIQDAYTTSSYYPYSQPANEGYNYIRNSVKVAVDAYNGDVKFYIVDDNDPILKTYRNIFPGLFTSADQVPDALRAHFRYPEDLFRVQAQMYSTYHMTDAQVFYNKEDQWSMPKRQAGDKQSGMDPYYVIMSLPGEEQEQFMLMLPFTPSGKDNMISWMSAKSDPGSYGKRIVYQFPKDKLVFGPMQVQARFNQDPTISSQVTLWGQSGSQVIFGNLLVIPINESILYVEPLFLRADKGQIPELKRVLVSYGGRVVMEDDLSSALEKIFATPLIGAPQKPTGTGTGTTATDTTTPPATASLKELANSAADHYNKATDAQKRGDWATYGNEIKQLEDVLRQMQAVSG